MPKLWLRGVGLLISLLFLSLNAQAETRLLLPASLGGLQEELKAAWPHEELLRIITGPTPQLVRQMEQGLHATALITANQRWMEEAASKDLISKNSRHIFLKNTLHLAIKDKSLVIDQLRDLPDRLSKGDKLAICGPGPVPCGKYAKQALEEQGVFSTIREHIIYGKDAAATRRFLESGAVDFAILYASDIAQSSTLTSLLELIDIEAIYEIAKAQSADVNRYRQLLDFLESDKVQELLSSKGFQIEARP